MKTSNLIRLYSLDEIKDEFIGKRGSEKRELYEQELHLEVLGDMIKKVSLFVEL